MLSVMIPAWKWRFHPGDVVEHNGRLAVLDFIGVSPYPEEERRHIRRAYIFNDLDGWSDYVLPHELRLVASVQNQTTPIRIGAA